MKILLLLAAIVFLVWLMIFIVSRYRILSPGKVLIAFDKQNNPVKFYVLPEDKGCMMLPFSKLTFAEHQLKYENQQYVIKHDGSELFVTFTFSVQPEKETIQNLYSKKTEISNIANDVMDNFFRNELDGSFFSDQINKVVMLESPQLEKLKSAFSNEGLTLSDEVELSVLPHS